MFWGIMLESGKKYTKLLQRSFHITMAALGCESIKSNEPVSIIVEINQSQYVLCSLQAGKFPQQRLDLNFTFGEHVSFFIEGIGKVYLTGYFILPDPEKIYIAYDRVLQNDNEESNDLTSVKEKENSFNYEQGLLEDENLSKINKISAEPLKIFEEKTVNGTILDDDIYNGSTLPYAEKTEVEDKKSSYQTPKTKTYKSYNTRSGRRVSDNVDEILGSLVNGSKDEILNGDTTVVKKKPKSFSDSHIRKNIGVKSASGFYNLTSTPANGIKRKLSLDSGEKFEKSISRTTKWTKYKLRNSPISSEKTKTKKVSGKHKVNNRLKITMNKHHFDVSRRSSGKRKKFSSLK